MNYEESDAIEPIARKLRSIFPDDSDDALLSEATEIYIETVKPVGSNYSEIKAISIS
ncbi:MAG: hypothetical protein KME15_20545 [Drouetiella hepatica Uher 2000/2452]|jgi:hypothetical protein|uniref:Uncharacterized protein n=1 Tax=Drouetiella hepatica Uher 2000/2452 TaxID=904376 RepID=A0A951UNS1_9CYAN|nr:hypothetical protein [Drouetiella hepatica Uher 2000/2452]